MSLNKNLIFTILTFFIPLFAAAASTIKGIFEKLTTIVRATIPAMMVLATVLFLWGVITYLYNADNEDARTQGRIFMIYGIVGLFVMVAVWGLVWVVYNSFFS